MSKLLKLLAILVGAVVALIIAAVIALPLLFDPNDFKQEITDLVRENTGRELTIQDDIKLSVFPWLGVELGSVELSNAKGFGKTPFATVKHAGVRVKLLPLLRKEVEMDTVTLEGLSLNLIKGKSGRTNWDDLVTAKPAESEKPAEEGGVGLAALAIGGLNVRDSQLRWTDNTARTQYTLDNLVMQTGPLSTGLPVDIDIAFHLKSKQPDMQGPVKLKGSITLDIATQNYKLSNLRLTTQLKGKDLPGGQLNSSLAADISTDLASQRMKIAGLKLEALGLNITGEINGSKLLDKPSFSGNLKTASFNPRKLVEGLSGEPLNTADKNALSSGSLQTRLSATTDSVKLTDLKVKLDDTTLTGTVSINNFAKPATKFDLKLDKIDLDRYLPPVAPGGQQAKASPASAAAAAGGQIPVDTLRTLNASGKFHIGEMKASNVRSQDIRITLNAKNGIVRLYPLSAKMYGGTYSGNTRIDARGKSAQYSIDEKISGVQSSPLLRDFTGNDRIEGIGNFSIKLKASGNTPDEIRRTMNGQTAFQFLDGAYKGVNVAKLIRKAYAQYKGLPPPPDTGPDKTDFSEFSGSGNIVNGVLHNNDLNVKAPLLRVGGKGFINLINETINYRVNTSVTGDLEGQGGKPITELKGVTIPIQIKGPLANPEFRLDLGSVLKQKLKKKIEKKWEKKLLEKLGGKTTEPAPTSSPPPAEPQPAPQQAPAPVDEKKELKNKLKRKLLEGLFK